VFGFLVGFAVLFLIFGLYRYDHSDKYLVRINRIAQNVSYLTSDGWKNFRPDYSPADVK